MARAVFCIWLRPGDYDAIKRLVPDHPELADTFEQWQQAALERVEELESRGFTVKMPVIDPQAFTEWCRAGGADHSEASLDAFAALVALEEGERTGDLDDIAEIGTAPREEGEANSMQISIGVRSLDDEADWLVALDPSTKAKFLAALAYCLTVLGRDSYDPDTKGVFHPECLRQVNEIQNRVLAALRDLLTGEGNISFEHTIAQWVLRPSHPPDLRWQSVLAWEAAKNFISGDRSSDRAIRVN